jgi:hypothetical protein
LHDVFDPRVFVPALAEQADRSVDNLLAQPRFLSFAKTGDFLVGGARLPGRTRLNPYTRGGSDRRSDLRSRLASSGSGGTHRELFSSTQRKARESGARAKKQELL